MKYSFQLFLIFLGLVTYQPTCSVSLPVIPKPNHMFFVGLCNSHETLCQTPGAGDFVH